MTWAIYILMAGAMLVSNAVTPLEAVSPPTPNTGSYEETEQFDQTYKFDKNGTVELSNVNGSISIDTWDKDEIRLEYTKRADSKEELSRFHVDIRDSKSKFSVETKIDRGSSRYSRGRFEVQYHLTVPRSARIDEISSVNGSVEARGTENYTEIAVVNGKVDVKDIRGSFKISSVNGTVLADVSRITDDSDISMETVNGSLKLRIPSNADATLKADTLNGNIRNSFGMPVTKGKYVGSNLHSRLGSGAARITLNSVNGAIDIELASPFNGSKQVTNLLGNEDAETRVETSEELDTLAAKKEAAATIRAAARKKARAETDARLQKRTINAAAASERSKEAAKTVSVFSLEGLEIEDEDIDFTVDDFSLSADKPTARANRAIENFRNARFFRNSPYVEEKSGTTKVEASPKVEIDAEDADVNVYSWEKGEVKYSLRHMKKGYDAVPVKVTQVGSKTVISVDEETRSGDSPDDVRTALDVYVPRVSNIAIRTEGNIRVEGISGSIKAATDSGDLDIVDSEGTLNINADGISKHSLVRVIGFRGSLEAVLDSTSAFLDGDFTKMNVAGDESSINLALGRDTDAVIIAESLDVGTLKKLASTNSIRLGDITEDSATLGNGNSHFEFDLDESVLSFRARDSIFTLGTI
ncbi:MAG: DUF4097 family beta strand repeat-containing protein [Pyrinomonadaceae bacterium]